MPAAKYDLYIEKGATYRQTLYWQIGAPPEPVDLTNFTARMKIRAAGPGGGTTELAELTTENSRIELSQEPGRIDLEITATDTETLMGLAGVYDLELVNGTEVTRLIEGEVRLSPEVTRP